MELVPELLISKMHNLISAEFINNGYVIIESNDPTVAFYVRPEYCRGRGKPIPVYFYITNEHPRYSELVRFAKPIQKDAFIVNVKLKENGEDFDTVLYRAQNLQYRP